MYSSMAMEKVITEIAKAHGFDLFRGDGSELIISVGGYMDLHIVAYMKEVVRVMHTYTQNGDCMYDPDVTFVAPMIEGNGWEPLSYEQSSLGLYHVCARFERGIVNVTNPQRQKSITTFANSWARNLRAQGFASVDAKVRVAA